MSRAKRAMDQCQKKLEPLYRNQLLSLDIGSLGNFRNSIVFAKVRSDEQVMKLREIADIVEDCFLDEEIVSTEKSGSFKPHITVMKLTRDKSFRKKGNSLSHLMRLWYFLSSVNSFFKRDARQYSGARGLIFRRTLCLLPYVMCCEQRRLWQDCESRLRGCAGSPEPSLVAYVISTTIS